MRVNTGSAKQPPPGMALKTIASLAGLGSRVMASRFTGAYEPTPFFQSPTGAPVVAVDVLPKAERTKAYSAA